MQKKSPLQANFNEVKFNTISAQKMRVLMTPYPGFDMGLKEIQVFETGVKVPVEPNKAPTVEIQLDDSYNQVMKERLVATVSDDSQPLDFPELTWNKKSGPGSVVFSAPQSVSTVASFSEEGTYIVTLTADDGELSTTADFEVIIEKQDVNLGLGATPSTSFISSWEDLNGINNGIDPKNSRDKTGGAYGNWNNSSKTQWVQYTWDHPVVIDQSSVYWWTDGGGIQMPEAYTLQYLDNDGTTWKDVEVISGLKVEPDKYNTTAFKPVETKALRMTITRGNQWTGILEWKVLEPPVIAIHPSDVKVRVLKGERPELPETVQKVFDGFTQEVNVTWDSISDEQLQQGDTEINIWGALESSHHMIPATVYVRSEESVTINTISEETITTYAGVEPTLPSVVEVQYNDGSWDNMNVSVKWDPIDSSHYSKIGTFTVYGAVEGTDKKAVATVTVKPTNDYFNSLIEKAKSISNEDGEYTEESYQALQEAIKDAEALGTIESEEELSAAIAALQEAIDGLVKITMTHDKLAELTKTYVSEYGAPGSHGIINSLVKKLENAKNASDRGNEEDAKELLQSYIDSVTSHSGEKLTKEHAEELIRWAKKLLTE
jgi:hypothetical protein